jgi:hypothetical protein
LKSDKIKCGNVEDGDTKRKKGETKSNVERPVKRSSLQPASMAPCAQQSCTPMGPGRNRFGGSTPPCFKSDFSCHSSNVHRIALRLFTYVIKTHVEHYGPDVASR